MAWLADGSLPDREQRQPSPAQTESETEPTEDKQQ